MSWNREETRIVVTVDGAFGRGAREYVGFGAEAAAIG